MLQTAIDIAHMAGQMAVDRRGKVSHEDKADGTWVTGADRECEELIRRQLAVHFPGHAVLGEEFGGTADLSQGPVWAIDPIDGTGNYVAGLPIWGVSMALLVDGVPELGVVTLPLTRETFAARAGQGAQCNGNSISAWREGPVGFNSLIALNSDAVASCSVDLPAKIRNLGSMAAHGCYVASGALVAAVFERWHVWDLAAALCIAGEAGAVAQYLDGSPWGGLGDLGAATVQEPLVLGPAWAVAQVTAATRQR